MAVSTNVLSLCAGGGGLDLGIELAVRGARTVVYVENEVTAAAVLVANMEAQRLPAAPLWTDLRTFDGRPWRGVVDLVAGGYPCQPFSNAGKRLGTADPRHLWPEVRRIVSEVQPERCFFENVGAHLRLGFHEVARDLQGMGYRVAAVLLTAEEVGAPHKRERLFIMADSKRWRRSVHGNIQAEPPGYRSDNRVSGENGDSLGYSGSIDAAVKQTARWQTEEHLTPVTVGALDYRGWPPGPDSGQWRVVLAEHPDLAPATEPEVRGVVDGVARGVRDEWLARSDQLHILGNGVVPQQAAYAYRLLEEALNGR